MDFPNLLMASPLFDKLQGLRLERVTWNGPVLLLVFVAHSGRENLVIQLHQEMQGLYIDPSIHEEFGEIHFLDERHDYSFLPSHIEGCTFLGGAPLRGQSLLRLDFSSSGSFKEDIPLSLYLEFFGGGRLILTDRENRVIRASRKGGAQHKPGAHYWLGEAEAIGFGHESPLPPSAFEDWPAALLARVTKGGSEAVDLELCRGIRGFDPESVRYLVERPRPHPIQKPESVLARRFGRWLDRIQHNREPVYVLSYPPDLRAGCRLLPFPPEVDDGGPLAGRALEITRFDDYTSALNHMGHSCLARLQVTELLVSVQRALEQRLKRNRRLKQGLEIDWEAAAGAGDMRRQADTLAAHLYELEKGQVLVEYADVHDSSRRIQIPLDPARSPQDNVSRLYRRAAKGERGLQTIELRLEEVRGRIEDDLEILDERLPALSSYHCRAPGELTALRHELLELGLRTSLLKAPARLGSKNPAKVALFRQYVLPGGWLVLVGRNNRENDLLTHKEAAAKDLWFHASGVAGSHVILRTGGHRDAPPRSILEGAAAIAAFHSKARNSATVPVIYTEKRYVRKPRKGAPGLALCAFEKTLFVSPGITGEIPR